MRNTTYDIKCDSEIENIVVFLAIKLQRESLIKAGTPSLEALLTLGALDKVFKENQPVIPARN